MAKQIADAIVAVHAAFPADAFLADALGGYDGLELTPRVRQISRALHAHLPLDFDEAFLGNPSS